MEISAYHINATLLPEGRDKVDIWVVDGRYTFTPVSGATELSGVFMAPGMVDGHVHLSLDFANTGLPPGTADLVLHNAKRHLRSGVTVVRDAGYVQQLNLTDVNLPDLPDILLSGWIHVPEGRFFPGIDVSKATSPERLLARFEEVAAHGCKWFKIIADFPGADMNLFLAPLTYPVEIIREVVEAAHAVGVRVLAHSTGPDIGAIIETGVDSIEHGMSITPEHVRRMAELGTQWCPTIATAEGFLQAAEEKGMSGDIRAAYSARTTESLKLAMQLGVDVLAGSDELAHGTIDREIDAMVRHGMAVQQAIASATTVGRRALALPGIEEGAPADLVIWDEDPREDLSRLTRPSIVLGRGVPLDLSAVDVVPGTTQSARERHGDQSLDKMLTGENCVFADGKGHKHG
jgi:imidazolonepropionase-like amidohydrolase